ncbi:MAG: transcriptional regulator, BadM/Rrf2 family [Deferribacteraceae bacterium]|jgi:Rrf2 family protein|nr:transcriptional regulator, BadM/Rrf2 family [Deferribacteraceae bacterium]
MNLNVKTVYAMIAIGELTLNHGKSFLKASDISSKYNIPPRFLELTLNDLKTIGIINSKRGAKGGFYILKNPEEITLFDIINVTEASTKVFECEPLQNKHLCVFKNIFDDLNNTIADFFKSITAVKIAEIIRNKNTVDFII